MSRQDAARLLRALLVASVAAAAGLLSGCSRAGSTLAASSPRPTPELAVLVDRATGASAVADRVVALRRDGVVELVDVRTKRTYEVASGADPRGAIAELPLRDVAFVTARGHDGLPAVWALPLTGSSRPPVEVVDDAELPSVSPDGGFLGYVTLDALGRQDGVAISALTPSGRPTGHVTSLATPTVPARPAITAIAVGRRGAELAVWGDFVDSYLGPRQPTVGTVNPTTATTLGALVAVNDGDGIDVGPLPPVVQPTPVKWWYSAPVYEPDGYLLVGSQDGGVRLPFSQDSGGINTAGVRYLLHAETGASPVTSLAFGPGSSLVVVTAQGRLELFPGAAYLPYGPGAEVPLPGTPRAEVLGSGFAAVAWTSGPAAARTPVPRLFAVVTHLPNLVGMTETQAQRVLASLDLPVMIEVVPRSQPKGVVTGQDPPAGDGVACQCAVVLHVSSGPG